MTTVLMPYTMLPVCTSILKEPLYTQIVIRSTAEHVQSILPRYLQGTSGITQLISSFIGSAYKWVRVMGDMDRIYANRNTDLYLLFWVCSHRLPIPDCIDDLRSHWYRPGTTMTRRRTHCIDKGSQMLPVGQGGLYFTRTGHLGTPTELARLVRSVVCNGYVTATRPLLQTTGRHVLVTNRPLYWANCPAVYTIIGVEHLHSLDPSIAWDSVVLDQIRPSSPSVCYAYPDHRHLSGSISPDWLYVHSAVSKRMQTIVFVAQLPATTLDILDSMYLLQINYRGMQFIGDRFNQERVSFFRLAETLLLEGLLS